MTRILLCFFIIIRKAFLFDQSYIIFNMTFELSREQFGTLVLYDWKINLTCKEIHACLVQAWEDKAPSDRTVLNCFHEFQRNNYIIKDGSRCPGTAVNEETIDILSER